MQHQPMHGPQEIEDVEQIETQEDNAEWVQYHFRGDGPYMDGIRSAAKVALSASPDVREKVFGNTLSESIGYAAHEDIEASDIVELFHVIAERNGLLDEIGIDGVQACMAGAMLPHIRPYDVPVPDKPSIGDQKPVTKPEPLRLTDAAEWQGLPVPPREWLVRDRIPAGVVTLLSGDGAAGKTTIALQLAAATLPACRSDWLGALVERKGLALFFTAEEDDDEMQRRSVDLARHLGIELADLAGLKFHCLPGQDAVLGAPDRSGVIQPTPMFLRLEETARDLAPTLIVIEAAADVFAGNEIDRAQVRQFITLLRRLAALPSRPAVVLLAHPSLNGMATGSGTSGSTAWSNSVRSRLYFSSPRRNDGADDESDVRQLQVMKANYGPKGEAVKLRWQRGVFVPDSGAPSLERIAAEAEIDARLVRIVEKLMAQGRELSDAPSSTYYAPKIIAAHPDGAGVASKAWESAVQRAIDAGKLCRAKTSGPPTKRRSIIVPATQEAAE